MKNNCNHAKNQKITQKFLKQNKVISKLYNQKEQLLDLTQSQKVSLILRDKDWSQLKQLQLWNCKIDCLKLKIITKKQWPNLIKLWLSQNNIGSQGVKYLIKTYMPNLQKLYMRQCNIGVQGVKHLTKNNWERLIELFIDNISLDGYEILSKGNWKKLESIQFSTKQIPFMMQKFHSICQNALMIMQSQEYFQKQIIMNRITQVQIRFIQIGNDDEQF